MIRDKSLEELRKIARSGPFIRGTDEWEERELARQALGCHCLSFGRIGSFEPDRNVRYHYMTKG